MTDRYRLDQLISDGSHAQAWRGFDLQTERTVVVKVYKPELVGSVEQFEANIKRLSNLKFPGLLPILDHGTNDGRLFVVYELFEVGSLRDFASRQFISTQQITRWMIDLGETLEYAHSMGIFHQDIKPANVLIDLDGHALLSDFGIVPPATRDEQPGFSSEDLKYLSPEQLEGKPADARSDLYELGVVMHELLTGHLPYQSTELRAIRFEILRGAHVDLQNTPRELRHVCQKVLARDPAARYSSADKFVTDLRRSLAGNSTRRWAVITLGLILFFVGYGISTWWLGDNPSDRQSPSVAETNWVERVQNMPAKEKLAAVIGKLRSLNPEFDGQYQETIDEGVLIELILTTDHLTDISPLKALSGITSLTCFGTYSTQPNGRLVNLAPLRGLNLTKLIINNNDRISDLTPLEGMPLQELHFGRTSVSDLTPLSKLPLAVLACRHTEVVDLSPLDGIQLKELYCDHTDVSDLAPLRKMPLVELHCGDTHVSSLAPLSELPLKVLDCNRSLVSDLSPLRGNTSLTSLNILSTKVLDLSPIKEMPNIKLLWCDLDQKADRDVLQSLKSLQFINDNPVSVFWQEESHPNP